MAESVLTRTSAQSPVLPAVVHGLSLTDPRCAEVLSALPGLAGPSNLPQKGELSALKGVNPQQGEIPPALYPRAIGRDLSAALEAIEGIRSHCPASSHPRRLLGLASTWLAQLVRDLGHSRICKDHSSEFMDTLADVLAMLQGVVALLAGCKNCTSLASAATLIERAADTLAHVAEGVA